MTNLKSQMSNVKSQISNVKSQISNIRDCVLPTIFPRSHLENHKKISDRIKIMKNQFIENFITHKNQK